MPGEGYDTSYFDLVRERANQQSRQTGSHSMKRISTLLVIGLALLSAGAAVAKEVRGQVFIVTKAGPAIKLALAKVYVLSLDNIRVAQIERKAASELLENKLRPQREKIEAEIAALKAEADKTSAASVNYEFIAQLNQRLRELDREADNLRLKLATRAPADMAPARMTDADGMFTVEVPAGATLLIHAERTTPPEVYRWVLPGDELPAAKADVVLCSNHNLFQLPGAE